MKYLIFEWDSRKAKSNHKKHGVTFEEAKTAFFDEQAIVYSIPTIQTMKIGSYYLAQVTCLTK